jgi:hypothetical protein
MFFLRLRRKKGNPLVGAGKLIGIQRQATCMLAVFRGM